MEDKVRSFVRLIINRELTHEELDQFFEVVESNALTDTLTSFDKEGNAQNDTAITLMQQGDVFIYEIPTIEDPEAEESHRITADFAEVISDDFEIATTFS